MKYVAFLAMALMCAWPAEAGLDGYVFLYPIESSFDSQGEAAWYGWLRELDSEAELHGTHSVHGAQIFDSPFQITGRFSNHLQGPAEPGSCYGTTLEVTANRGGWGGTSTTFTGDTRCAPPPPPPTTKPPISGTEIDVTPSDGHTPIVIALQARYEFTDVDDGVQFDIDADGDADRVSWPRDGSVAFLFHDRNGNGVPDNGGELFGNYTRLNSGTTARHGFEALLEFDANADGAVTADDERWAELRLWQDVDHDGLATVNEISTLDAGGIASLGLRHHWTGRRDAHGNILRWQSDVVHTATGPRPYYDVYLMDAASARRSEIPD